jgi:hypothetical protein
MLRLDAAPIMFLVRIIKLIISLEKNAAAGGAVIAADYVEMGNIKFVATTSNNNSINFWDSTNYLFRERINTSDIQMTVKWCGAGVNRLFSAGCDQVIHAYDI